jgi:hypothetical protein
MSRSYTASPPWRLHGVEGHLYFTFTYDTRLSVRIITVAPPCVNSFPRSALLHLFLFICSFFYDAISVTKTIIYRVE